MDLCWDAGEGAHALAHLHSRPRARWYKPDEHHACVGTNRTRTTRALVQTGRAPLSVVNRAVGERVGGMRGGGGGGVGPRPVCTGQGRSPRPVCTGQGRDAGGGGRGARTDTAGSVNLRASSNCKTCHTLI
jgi:hypothetical protein